MSAGPQDPASVLTVEEVGDRHEYLAGARPDWSRSMGSIVAEGGPWKCYMNGCASLLVYRCSVCGADLAGHG